MSTKDIISRRKLSACPFCKNEDTNSIMDIGINHDLKVHYHSTSFFAYQCNLCDGMWHFSETTVLNYEM